MYNFGVVAIDCSWNKANIVFDRRFRGIYRRLPLLLAANPTNYGKIGLLSSVEALASALYIAGFEKQALKTLSIFKWGRSFSTLNESPLLEYRSAVDNKEAFKIEREFFLEDYSHDDNDVDCFEE